MCVPTVTLVLAACFGYTPVNSAPSPGADVRIRLTDQGTTELARYLGPRVVRVDGRVVGHDANHLRVSVQSVQTVDGANQPWRGEQAVDFPAATYSNIERREFKRSRTTLIAGGLAVAMAVIGYQAVQNGGGGTVSGGGGGGGNQP
jgi:hypothetical protein